ncbi:MAG: hypothetical protein IPK77_01525 [Cellvibrio sp.]|nr:hypothetical protein [Cellvibrio sp.]
MYPKFTITDVNFPGSVVGSLDRLNQGEENWVGDNFVGFLYKDSTLSFGRWFKEGTKWRFTFDKNEMLNTIFVIGETIDCLDGYWGERVELVVSGKFNWKCENYKGKENWDHDHCEICWATISEIENAVHYCSEGKHPICKECYDKHVSIRDLSFLPKNV